MGRGDWVIVSLFFPSHLVFMQNRKLVVDIARIFLDLTANGYPLSQRPAISREDVISDCEPKPFPSST
jgi:hypothetical protein